MESPKTSNGIIMTATLARKSIPQRSPWNHRTHHNGMITNVATAAYAATLTVSDSQDTWGCVCHEHQSASWCDKCVCRSSIQLTLCATTRRLMLTTRASRLRERKLQPCPDTCSLHIYIFELTPSTTRKQIQILPAMFSAASPPRLLSACVPGNVCYVPENTSLTHFIT